MHLLILSERLPQLDEPLPDAAQQLLDRRIVRREADGKGDVQRDLGCDVEGLVKLVDLKEIAANDWSLTPGRYVGVAPEEEDENFDFEETLREIHVELDDLNAEAAKLAERIKKNFEELGI